MFRDGHIQSSVSHSLEVILVDAMFTLCCNTYSIQVCVLKNAKTEIIGHLPLMMMSIHTMGVML